MTLSTEMEMDDQRILVDCIFLSVELCTAPPLPPPNSYIEVLISSLRMWLYLEIRQEVIQDD